MYNLIQLIVAIGLCVMNIISIVEFWHGLIELASSLFNFTVFYLILFIYLFIVHTVTEYITFCSLHLSFTISVLHVFHIFTIKYFI